MRGEYNGRLHEIAMTPFACGQPPPSLNMVFSICRDICLYLKGHDSHCVLLVGLESKFPSSLI